MEKDAKKKKKPGRSYNGWLAHLRKMNCPEETYEAFKGRWKGALEYANENKKRFKTKEDREEYAARTALDKLPKKYIEEPGPEHGPGKSGPLVTPKKKKANLELLAFELVAAKKELDSFKKTAVGWIPGQIIRFKKYTGPNSEGKLVYEGYCGKDFKIIKVDSTGRYPTLTVQEVGNPDAKPIKNIEAQYVDVIE